MTNTRPDLLQAEYDAACERIGDLLAEIEKAEARVEELEGAHSAECELLQPVRTKPDGDYTVLVGDPMRVRCTCRTFVGNGSAAADVWENDDWLNRQLDSCKAEVAAWPDSKKEIYRIALDRQEGG